MVPVCKKVWRIAFTLFTMAACSFTQDVPSVEKRLPPVKPLTVPLDKVSTVEIPSVSAQSIVMPVLCGPDGGILFRLAMPDTGLQDPISVSEDGKTVIRFGKEKINDIDNPVPVSLFLAGSEVYLLVRGSVPLGSETKCRTPTGKIEIHPASRTTTFVARFDREGRYERSIPLDLPFKPLHLGVFSNGDFLVAGAEPSNDEPRVAIVASNGQLRRFVELKGDVHGQHEDEKAKAETNRDPTALPRFASPAEPETSLFDVVYTSQITNDGENLILFRPSGAPVFSISPSGEVRSQRLKVDGDYRLFAIKSTENSWIAELIRDLPNGAGEEFVTYAFDSQTGSPLRQYLFPTDMGFGLACTDGNQFTFVIANDSTKTLSLVKLAPLTAGRD